MELTNEQLAEALMKADALAQEGNAEARQDAIILSQEFQRRRSQGAQVTEGTSSQSTDGDSAPPMSFLNKSLATLAGSPVDITNALLNIVGLGSEYPIGGSQSIRDAMNIGIETPIEIGGVKQRIALGGQTLDREPETMLERGMQVAGDVLGFGAAGLKGAQALSKLGGPTLTNVPYLSATKDTLGRIGQRMFDPVVQNPLKALAIESSAIPGMTLARDVSVRNEFSPTNQMLLELAGGATPTGLFTLATKTPIFSAFKASVFPFTEAGGKVRASRRVKELVKDPQEIAKRLKDIPEGNRLSPAAIADDPGLMQLEKAVFTSLDQAQQTGISLKRSELIEELRKQILQPGKLKNTQGFLKNRIKRLSKTIDIKIEEAADNAGIALKALQKEGLDPIQMRRAANSIVRNAIDDALKAARSQEDELWRSIPLGAKGGVSRTIAKYKEIKGKLSSSELEDIPSVAINKISPSAQVRKGPKGTARAKVKRTSVKELYGLYKKLGQVASNARAGDTPNFNKARIAEELREAILSDLDKFTGPDDVSALVSAARAYSNELNKKFSQGPVGKVLGYKRQGGARVDEELTIDTLLSGRRVKGKLGVKALTQATDDPNALEGISLYLRGELLDKVDPNTGRIPPRAFQTFASQNAELLELVPSLSKQLSVAETADDILRRVTNRKESFRRTFDKKSSTAINRLINANVNKEVKTILNSPDPVQSMKSLVRSARKDKSGEALKGLKAALSEYLIDIVTSKSKLDVGNRPMINALTLDRNLRDANFTAPLREVFTAQEMANIRTASKNMAAIQKVSMSDASERIINDKAGYLLEKSAQIVGAKIGAKLSGTAGGSIQSASIGSSAARKFLNNLTGDKAKQLLVDAVSDPELMRVLLTHNKANKVNERVIRNYMLSPIGSRLVDEATLTEAEREARTEGRK